MKKRTAIRRTRKPIPRKALIAGGVILGLILIFYISYAISFHIFSGSMSSADDDTATKIEENIPKRTPAPSDEPSQGYDPEDVPPAPAETDEPEETKEPTETDEPKETGEPSKKPEETKKPAETDGPKPSASPAPTASASPTPSAVPVPTPPSEHLSDTGL